MDSGSVLSCAVLRGNARHFLNATVCEQGSCHHPALCDGECSGQSKAPDTWLRDGVHPELGRKAALGNIHHE